jgi:OmpA-OmpF porin, OOP family
MNKTRVACLGLATALAIASTAAAEDGVPLDRYQPSFAGDALFSTPDAAVKNDFRPSARIDFSYAHAPLVVLERSSDGTRDLGRLVSREAIVHYLLSLDLLGRLALDLDLPVTLSQSGDDGARASVSPRALGGGLNDLRLGTRFELFEQNGLAPAAALRGALFLPTGGRDGFSGSGTARYAIAIDLGGDYEHLLWRGFVAGHRSADGDSGLRALLGSGVSFGAGLAWKQGGLQLGPELFGSRVLNDAGSTFAPSKTNLELLLGARYRIGPFVLGCAGGPGLTQAAGTPSFRLLGSLAFVPEASDPARARSASSDGAARSTTDSSEATLDRSASGGAALARDRDGDGVPDANDACADLAGDASPSAARRGCPKDTDGDAIFDVDDRCPLVAGVVSADPEQYGCPRDTDGDGIVDSEDACVNERGPRRSEPRTNGCPAAVRVEGSQIVILQQVTFATGSDTIESSSFDLLGQVAAVLLEHPEIARLAVDGHTDDVGAEQKNLALSRRRALSVTRWLIAHGVDERRIEARGFGPRQPLDSSRTAEARAKNRRVEFLIVKRSELGAAGWKDGVAE